MVRASPRRPLRSIPLYSAGRPPTGDYRIDCRRIIMGARQILGNDQLARCCGGWRKGRRQGWSAAGRGRRGAGRGRGGAAVAAGGARGGCAGTSRQGTASDPPSVACAPRSKRRARRWCWAERCAARLLVWRCAQMAGAVAIQRSLASIPRSTRSGLRWAGAQRIPARLQRGAITTAWPLSTHPEPIG